MTNYKVNGKPSIPILVFLVWLFVLVLAIITLPFQLILWLFGFKGFWSYTGRPNYAFSVDIDGKAFKRR